MTKVEIDPGICGFVTTVEATAIENDEDIPVKEVHVKVKSGCASIQRMMGDLGDTFDAYKLLWVAPGQGLFYDYAASHEFDPDVGCPIICGIIKCIEVECDIALVKDSYIRFIKE